MLSDEVLEKVVERLTNRIEQGNTYVLEKIGESIKKVGTLTPSKAKQLEQVLKYGGDYNKIINKLKEITKLNIKDIKKIFDEVSKKDYEFAKQFYDYRNISYIPYEKNITLQNQVKLLTDQVTKEYLQLTNTKALGFVVKNPITKTEIFKPLKQAYFDTIDSAILNVSEGKTTFDEELYKMLKEYGESGIKTIKYSDNRKMRLDSAIRMQMRGALRELHGKNQELIGQEFGSNGVEISVHLNPAPDHALVQGKQFSTVKPSKDEMSEFEKFQNDKDCHSFDGTFFSHEYNGHDRRSIGQYNCYHYTFAIILGVNKPEYSNEELKQIIDNNNKGFIFDGKRYTNYEGTQLQRQIETEIRKQKDIQIAARKAGISEDIDKSQKNITLLTKKYKELSKISGLPTKTERMRVSGYKRISLNKIIENNENIIRGTHITTNENYNSIMKNGFNLSKVGEGAGTTFGKGVYFANNENEILFYRNRLSNDNGYKEIEADIDTTGFLKAKYENYTKGTNYTDPIYDQLKETEKKEYNKLLKQYKEDNKIAEKLSNEDNPDYKKYWHIDPKRDAITKILKKNYPGLIIEQTMDGIDIITGGNQIVVYDLNRIKIKK